MNEHLGLDRAKLPTPYYEDPGIVIFHGDCREILPLLPKVDLVHEVDGERWLFSAQSKGGGFVAVNQTQVLGVR
jgi:hypothetical protein